MQPGLTDPASPSLLVVVAHPDDETFGCGSLLLHAAAAGMATAVLCATRGEAGESTDDTPASELGRVREGETRTAAGILGVGRVDFLDFGDSGMSGLTDASTLVGAPLADVSDAVREHIDTVRPTIVVTLDGMDGHRDHVRIGEATLAAVEAATWQVERVYLHGVPKALLARWVEHMAATDPSWEHLRGNVPGTPDDLITTVVDTAEHLEARERAIRAHASQRSPFEGLPEDLRRAFVTAEYLRRVRPDWTGGEIETELVPA